MVASEQVRQPVRVIIDTQNRLTPDLRLFSQHSPIILIRQHLEKSLQWPQFVEQIVVSQCDGKADLVEVVRILSERGFNHLWIEAGATLAGAFINQQLVDEVILYQAPKLMGDQSRSLLNLPELTTMSQVIDLTISDLRMVGRDIRITAEPKTKRQ